MPRTARLILDCACYHVISRGNGKMVTFKSDGDYERYMKFLLKYKKKYGVKVYGWCLMNNHPHLILDTELLSKAMHGINMSYAKYFRCKSASYPVFFIILFVIQILVFYGYFFHESRIIAVVINDSVKRKFVPRISYQTRMVMVIRVENIIVLNKLSFIISNVNFCFKKIS